MLQFLTSAWAQAPCTWQTDALTAPSFELVRIEEDLDGELIERQIVSVHARNLAAVFSMSSEERLVTVSDPSITMTGRVASETRLLAAGGEESLGSGVFVGPFDAMAVVLDDSGLSGRPVLPDGYTPAQPVSRTVPCSGWTLARAVPSERLVAPAQLEAGTHLLRETPGGQELGTWNCPSPWACGLFRLLKSEASAVQVASVGDAATVVGWLDVSAVERDPVVPPMVFRVPRPKGGELLRCGAFPLYAVLHPGLPVEVGQLLEGAQVVAVPESVGGLQMVELPKVDWATPHTWWGMTVEDRNKCVPIAPW